MLLSSKSEFAERIGVSAARVSQYIAEGKIGPAEMEGEGRYARIRTEAAIEKLKLTLDPAQKIANGQPLPKAEAAPKPASEIDQLDLQLRREKLQQAQAQNRKALEEERARQGLYMRTADARAEMTKLMAMVLHHVEGGLTELAQAIAAQFNLPPRDVTHAVTQQSRAMRTKISERLASDADNLGDTIADEDGLAA